MAAVLNAAPSQADKSLGAFGIQVESAAVEGLRGGLVAPLGRNEAEIGDRGGVAGIQEQRAAEIGFRIAHGLAGVVVLFEGAAAVLEPDLRGLFRGGQQTTRRETCNDGRKDSHVRG